MKRLLAGLVSLAAEVASAGTPAAGGVQLLEAMETATAVVVGRITDVERLDTHGYAAQLNVETIPGSAPERIEASQPIRIAWEELSRGRPPRFAPGDRVLVCLEPLPSASIWTRRLPDAATRAHTAGIAMNGDAFLREPGLGTLDVLHHYLSLARWERDSGRAADQLSRLAATAQPALAISAARQLASIEDLPAKLTPRTASQLTRALARQDLPGEFAELWGPTLSRSRSSQLEAALRYALKEEAAAPQLFEALASVATLSDAQASFLQAHANADYRLVLARTSVAPGRLRELARSDSDASVRSAALTRLVRLEGARALNDALVSLADPDPQVRAAAALAAGGLGEVAVKGLESVAYGSFEPCAGSLEAPRSALAGLGGAGAAGRRSLAKIASDHPQEALRKLARIALGELESHEH